MADHAVSAHGGQHQDLRVGQVLGLAFEARANSRRCGGGMPAAWQHCSAPSIDVEMLMLSPRSASLTALTKSSAATRLSNTAAHGGGRVQPVDHRFEIGRHVALPVRERDSSLRDGRSAPPCRASPRFTGLNRQRHLAGTAAAWARESSSFLPRLAMANTT